ncbi:MAG: dihydrofolate reductase family protein [Rikenellaceae bacterium]
MSVVISVAISADGYIDDMTPKRLVLSTPEDWAEVYRLRAEADVIVIGAQTLRNDNPSLCGKSEEVKAQREAQGRSREPRRVVICGGGAISPDLKIFHSGEETPLLFSLVERPELSDVAEVVVSDYIDAAYIITELEKRGSCRLFVEGGAQVLKMFFESRLVDSVRVACNPAIEVNDPNAPRLNLPEWVGELGYSEANFGGMEVKTYINTKNRDASEDRKMMERAIEVSRLSPPADTCYRVGAVIVTAKGEVVDGFTHETSTTHHAEQAAISKALAQGLNLRGATIYSSIEPCSKRVSEPKSCSELLVEHGFARVIFALYEPSVFVCCQGAYNLRKAGAEVEYLDGFSDVVREINAHVIQ